MNLAVAVASSSNHDDDDAAPALAGLHVPWSEEECSQLLAGLQNLGNDWSSINKQYVKSRTKKQIQRRYHRRADLAIHQKEDMDRALATYDANKNNNSSSSSNNNNNNGRADPWSEEECSQLLAGLQNLGIDWSSINQQYVKSRTKKQIKSRYHNRHQLAERHKEDMERALATYDSNNSSNSSSSNSNSKGRRPWSEEECSQVLLGLQNLGNDWSSINKQYVKSRTPKQIQSRYYNRHQLAERLKEDMERALATYDANNNNNSNNASNNNGDEEAEAPPPPSPTISSENLHQIAAEKILAASDASKNDGDFNNMLECYIRCLTVLIRHAEEDMLGVGPEADEAAAFVGEVRDLLNENSADTSVLATQEPVNEI